MGFKEAFQKWNEKKKEEREEFKRLERNQRFHKRLEEKQKSPAQKELDFYQKEKDRENLREKLEQKRKQRNEKMKNLSDPFNKKNNSSHGLPNIMQGKIKFI